MFKVRAVLLRKYCLSFGFCPPTPPSSPKLGQRVQLFSEVGIQDLKDSLGLKMLYVLYIIIPYIYNLKKQFKVQIIGILDERDSFY